MKLKSFCKAKDIVNKTNQQPTDWERIFTNPTSNRGLTSKIYKLKKLITKQPNDPIKKIGYRTKTENSQLRNLEWLRAPKEMFKVLSDQRNVNQNDPEIPPYINQNG
jgi:hypothetical protein